MNISNDKTTTAVYEQRFLELLNSELVVALGCTEPMAIAYAAAVAKQYVKAGEVIKAQVTASGNIIKNAMSVTIPGTAVCGIDLATAFGVVAGDAAKKLEVLSGITATQIEQGKNMVETGKVAMSVADTSKKLYIEIIVSTADSYAKVVIADQHTNVVLIEVDGQIIQQSYDDAKRGEGSGAERNFLTLASVWQFVMEVDFDKLEIIKESIELNKTMALEGLRNAYGLQVGRTICNSIERKLLADDLANVAMALTAAASDARMAGSSLPVMSNSGSGNQGLCATLPVVAVGEKLGVEMETMVRAVALSHLVTIYIKSNFGRLSAFCGATVAGTGASCGITYLLGGDLTNVTYAVQNMLGNVTGMLCDGAKAGCALKVSTCTNGAVQSAMLAMENLFIQSTDGIIEKSADASISNLCRLGNQGTLEADRIILDIMLNKNVGCCL